MANPKFRDHHDATDEYTLVTLNLDSNPPIPSAHDRLSIDKVSQSSDGRVQNVEIDTELRMHPLEFDCDETQMLELQKWHAKGGFILFPDSALGPNYDVFWVDPQFAPQILPGGRFLVRCTLQEVTTQ